MRIVRESQDLASAFRSARSEAESAFGDPRIYIEKYLEHPRHIEFQILADRYGEISKMMVKIFEELKKERKENREDMKKRVVWETR